MDNNKKLKKKIKRKPKTKEENRPSITYEEYTKLINMFAMLIKKNYGKYNIEFIRGDSWGDKIHILLTVIFNDTHQLMISPLDNWHSVKKTIDDLLLKTRSNECQICFNNSKHFCSCDVCNKQYCMGCHIDIIKTNKGISLCPFCRYTTGFKMSKKTMNKYIDNFNSYMN